MCIDEVIKQLNETIIEIGDIKGLKDASATQVLSLWRRSKERELRGLYTDDGHIFWWDSSVYAHFQAAAFLGIESFADHRVMIIEHAGKPVFDNADWTAVLDGRPMWQTYLNHHELLFHSPKIGYCLGRDLVAAHQAQIL